MATERVLNVRVALMDMKPARYLLNWINQTLMTNLRHLSELSTGVVYCQLMHEIFPQSIDISAVIFSTKLRDQYAVNYKLLQKSFMYLNLSKCVPERKLQHGCGHMDFANWFYKFYHIHKTDEPHKDKTDAAVIAKERSQTILDISQNIQLLRNYNFPLARRVIGKFGTLDKENEEEDEENIELLSITNASKDQDSDQESFLSQPTFSSSSDHDDNESTDDVLIMRFDLIQKMTRMLGQLKAVKEMSVLGTIDPMMATKQIGSILFGKNPPEVWKQFEQLLGELSHMRVGSLRRDNKILAETNKAGENSDSDFDPC